MHCDSGKRGRFVPFFGKETKLLKRAAKEWKSADEGTSWEEVCASGGGGHNREGGRRWMVIDSLWTVGMFLWVNVGTGCLRSRYTSRTLIYYETVRLF